MIVNATFFEIDRILFLLAWNCVNSPFWFNYKNFFFFFFLIFFKKMSLGFAVFFWEKNIIIFFYFFFFFYFFYLIKKFFFFFFFEFIIKRWVWGLLFNAGKKIYIYIYMYISRDLNEKNYLTKQDNDKASHEVTFYAST